MIAIVLENRLLRIAVVSLLIGGVWAGRLQAGERAPRLDLLDPAGNAVVYTPPDPSAPAPAGPATATVIAFVRPGQTQSVSALQDLRGWRTRHTELAPRVRTIAVASGELSKDEVQSLLDHLPASASIALALDPQKSAFSSFGVIALPTTFVIDARGAVVTAQPGRSASFVRNLEKSLATALGLEVTEDAATEPETDEEKKARRLMRLADDLIKRRRFEDAAEQIAKAAELVPEDVEVRVALGTVRLRAADGPGAKEAFDAALALDPEHRAAREGVAKALALGDDLEAAETALRNALKMPPQSAELHYYLGRVLERAERVEEAVAAYRRAYELLEIGR